MDKVLALDGKTYSWKKGQFADYEFADGVQYGLIAQDVEK
ncbi:MAG: tail fiber domain-containing protein, partial [Flavobacteriaceae bacterium]|nr:tail fiber domain-containing protein [Flavobacteriaceae bacterium]